MATKEPDITGNHWDESDTDDNHYDEQELMNIWDVATTIIDTNTKTDNKEKSLNKSSITRNLPRATSTVKVTVNLDETQEDSVSVSQLTIQKTVARKLPNKTASCTDLLSNEFLYYRISMLFVTMFVLALSIFYGFGQVLTLILDDYWCTESYEWDEIREHSVTHNLTKGADETCWATKHIRVDESKLWSQESYGYKFVDSGNTIPILKSITFFIISFVLCSLAIYYIIKLIVDINKYSRFGTLKLKTEQTHTANSDSASWIIKIYNVYLASYKWYDKHFGLNTGKWVMLRLMAEIIELILQSQALLLYNGVYIFADEDDNDVYLAYNRKYIILFASVLFVNCISVGFLWLFYAFKPQLCHGLAFELIITFVDIMYDLFYSIFPLIVVLSNHAEKNIAVSLASLQTNNMLSFLATWIPIIFLTNKCYSLSYSSMHGMKEYYHTENNNKQIKRQQSVLLRIKSLTTLKMRNTKSWILSTQYTFAKQSVLCMLSVIFIVYGTVVLVIVMSHFNYAVSYCNQIVNDVDELHDNNGFIAINETFKSQDLLNDRPELYLWDHCQVKVYPFDTICDCRLFRYKIGDINETHSDFGFTVNEFRKYFKMDLIDIITNIFKSFRMLEKVRILDINDIYIENGIKIPPLNFTSDMFIATELRVISLWYVVIGEIDESISNWENINYMNFGNTFIKHLPSTFNQLINLQYLQLSQNPFLNDTLLSFCSFNKLQSLILATNDIVSVPECIVNLKELRIIVFLNMPLLTYLPLELFNLDELIDLNLDRAISLTINSIMEYNHISSLNEFNTLFKYNNNTSFSFQQSGLCNSYHNSSVFNEFVNKTEACVNVCTDDFINFGCRPFDWRNGICNQQCNVASCFWDGGDCHMLCECDNYWNKLGNGICDIECNTTNCKYDESDCLPSELDQELCQSTYNEHGCKIEWVNDGWCDSFCYQSDCIFDGNDCSSECPTNLNCHAASEIWSFVANAIVDDKGISIEELCQFWDYLKDDIGEEFTNCSYAHTMIDSNNDTLLSLHETMVPLAQIFNVSDEKAMQVDCSACLNP